MAAEKMLATPDDECIVDGIALAKQKGLTLPPVPSLGDPAPKAKWAELALPIEE